MQFLLSNVTFVSWDVKEVTIDLYILRQKLYQRLRYLTWVLHSRPFKESNEKQVRCALVLLLFVVVYDPIPSSITLV